VKIRVDKWFLLAPAFCHLSSLARHSFQRWRLSSIFSSGIGYPVSSIKHLETSICSTLATVYFHLQSYYRIRSSISKGIFHLLNYFTVFMDNKSPVFFYRTLFFFIKFPAALAENILTGPIKTT